VGISSALDMSFLQDVKFGLRMLAREPGFTAVMVIALALGIGVNTTVFNLVNAVLLRGLPFDHAERVMYLSSNRLAKNRTDIGTSVPDFRDWAAQSKSFQAMAGFSQDAMTIGDDSGAPERYSGTQVTTNFFSLIGQAPMLGRDLLPVEDRASAVPVCILGYGIWERRYGSRADILGKTIRINEVPTTIVGVMPKGMKFPVNADLWIPLVVKGDYEKRDAREIAVFGRLVPGATLAQARAEMQAIAQRLAAAYPKSNEGVGVTVIPYNDKYNGGDIRTLFMLMLGAVGFVLLIACANVANLLLARALARTREVSIRAALGASRWRVIRQLLVESVLIGILGGLGGLALAYWGVGLFDKAVANVGKPYWIVFRFDLTVFAYLAAVCVAAGVLFGLAPALQLSRVDLNSTLKEGGRGSSGAARSRWLSGFLVVSEVALSLVLLVGAGLLARSFLNSYAQTAGIRAERFLTMRVDLSGKKYATDAARRAFYERLEPLLAATPGIEAGAIVSHPPAKGSFEWPLELEGSAPVEQDQRPRIAVVVAGPSYFATAGIALLRGRAFDDADGLKDKGAAIVSHRFAAKYWPGEDPIGKRLRLLWDGDRPWLTVVGVSQDVVQNNRPTQNDGIDPLVFIPYRGKPVSDIALLARANAPTSLSGPLRREIQSLDPDLPVFGVMTLQENFEQQRWGLRVFGSLFGVFAAIALLLSSVGLYATMAYSVTRRTQEIGVRVAMGASRGNILWLVVAQGLRQLGIGLVVGLGGAFALARLMKALLFRVSATDPVTFAAISALLLSVGVLACWLPARSAMKVEPTVALRYE
jgi:putative ABC transport system permease protein